MDEFKASFGADAPKVFSAEGSARFLQAASQHNITVDVYLFMDGYDGTPPSGPWTPEKVMEALAWFKGHEKGVKLQAKLSHYNTIEPNYPRTVNVPPDVFVDLRVLYTKVWDIRSAYSSLPSYYQNQFKNEYTNFDSGVIANQSIFVTDATERLAYQQQAEALRAQLGDVYARMDFYFKVKAVVGTEPGNGQVIEERADQQQSWLYGFSVYTKSTAVVIHTTELHYSDSWHIGWREHTFEWGPDQNYLIVGWQVLSNWGDGTNGSWWKAIDQILMTSHGAVHVKSQYDRGCDWTVRFYYVDAKDYEFGS